MRIKTLYLSVFSAVGTGQTSLFGNNQNKLGSTLGSVGTFGTGGFNTGANALNFGAPQQPVGQCKCFINDFIPRTGLDLVDKLSNVR